MRRQFNIALGLLVGIALGAWFASMRSGQGIALAENPNSSPARDNSELAKLYDEDQADRKPEPGKSIDWSAVGPRDKRRENRVKQLYESGELHTGMDCLRAAMVLQHASKPEDHLLAHELCVVALAKGEREARWLAAATEDRFLMNIGRPQRFGTQYRSSSPDSPVKLYEVGPGVTDRLRQEMAVPSLADARAREGLMNGLLKGKKR